MKNVWTIVKKEFSRFFKDKRMIISVLLPGLLIYIIYSLMGTITSSVMGTDNEDASYTACVVNMPESLSEGFERLELVEGLSEDEAKKKIADGELDLYIVFPENFLEDITAGKNDPYPNVKVYYDSSAQSSVKAFTYVNTVFEILQGIKFTVNLPVEGENIRFDLADEKNTAGKMLSMFMPMLMFALLVSGCVAVAPEAIAGEKERGTMATMLITPIKRWELALGKILSLSVFALLSGISSFLGVLLSLPKLMAGLSGGDMAAFYSAGDYFMIFGLIISAVLVIISAFSVMSAFAKSVKEAGALITPLMILIIVLGVVSMVLPSVSVGLYAIPLLGCELAMSAIFTFSITPLAFVLAIVSNFVLAVALVVALSFMFRNEKIMFNK